MGISLKFTDLVEPYLEMPELYSSPYKMVQKIEQDFIYFSIVDAIKYFRKKVLTEKETEKNFHFAFFLSFLIGDYSFIETWIKKGVFDSKTEFQMWNFYVDAMLGTYNDSDSLLKKMQKIDLILQLNTHDEFLPALWTAIKLEAMNAYELYNQVAAQKTRIMRFFNETLTKTAKQLALQALSSVLWAHIKLGNVHDAEQLLTFVETQSLYLNHILLQIWLLNAKANLYHLMGRFDQAERLFEDYVDELIHLGNFTRLSEALRNLADLYLLHGYLRKAEALYEQSIELDENNKTKKLQTLIRLALTKHLLDKRHESSSLLKEIEKKLPKDQSLWSYEVVKVFLLIQILNHHIENILMCRDLLKRRNHENFGPLRQIETAYLIGLAEETLGNLRNAIEMYSKGIAAAKQKKLGFFEVKLYSALVTSYLKLYKISPTHTNIHQAENFLTQAIDKARKLRLKKDLIAFDIGILLIDVINKKIDIFSPKLQQKLHEIERYYKNKGILQKIFAQLDTEMLHNQHIDTTTVEETKYWLIDGIIESLNIANAYNYPPYSKKGKVEFIGLYVINKESSLPIFEYVFDQNFNTQSGLLASVLGVIQKIMATITKDADSEASIQKIEHEKTTLIFEQSKHALYVLISKSDNYLVRLFLRRIVDEFEHKYIKYNYTNKILPKQETQNIITQLYRQIIIQE